MMMQPQSRAGSKTHLSCQHTDRGFTMVELLVVIGIIVLLIAILIPVVGKVRRAADGASTSAQLSAIASAIQQYYGDFKAYPGPLPNSQVGINYYPPANYTNAATAVYAVDPNNNNTAYPIQLGSGVGTSASYGAFPTDPKSGVSETEEITGSENLVLGLLGGLELAFNPANGNGIATISNFGYNPANIFPDGITPSPKGAMNLNPNSPKRWGPYLQVKAADISNAQSMGAPGQFTDAALRASQDSPIPEFLDKFPQPMPILYLRANVGGTAVVGIGGGPTPQSATPLKDTVAKPQVVVVPQYDLAQIQAYTGSNIGISPTAHHGLQMPGTVNGGDFATANAFGAGTTAATIGSIFPDNATVYFKDPSVVYDPTNNTTLSNTHGATARQKDSYILISAGPDGIYGTADDIIYPGSLNP